MIPNWPLLFIHGKKYFWYINVSVNLLFTAKSEPGWTLNAILAV